MTKLNYSVEDTSEDSPLDRYMGRKLACRSREAEVERDARRIAARPGLGGGIRPHLRITPGYYTALGRG